MNTRMESEILMEISLSVGSSLDLEQMLRGSLRSMLRLLNCSGGLVLKKVEMPDGVEIRWESVACMPRTMIQDMALEDFLDTHGVPRSATRYPDWVRSLPHAVAAGPKTSLLFELPGFGALLLENNGEPFSRSFLYSMQPLMTKLGLAAVACLEWAARVRRQERERFDLEFQTLVAEASTRFVHTVDQDGFDQAIQHTLASLGALFAMDRTYLFRFSENLATMDNSHEWCAAGIEPQIGRIQEFLTDRLPWWKQHILKREPLQIFDVAALPEEAAAEREEFSRQGIRSLLAVPIVDPSSQLLGFIGFDSVRRRHRWSQSQVAMLQVLGGIVGSTILRQRSLHALMRAAEDRRILLDNIQTQVWYFIDDSTYGLVNRAHADFFGCDSDQLAYRQVQLVHPPKLARRLCRGNRMVFAGGQARRLELWIPNRNGESRRLSVVKTPKLSPTGMVEYVVCSAEDITRQRALEEELHRQANTDGMTGLANRSAFMGILRQEVLRQRRYATALTLMMLDLDHFKAVNDTYGHAGGDAVLRHFANLLREAVRKTDVVGRLGGEEFVVLLPEARLEQGTMLAQRLCGATREAQVETGGHSIRYTVSIGVAELVAQDNADTLLQRADQALYRAKQQGRDRVATA